MHRDAILRALDAAGHAVHAAAVEALIQPAIHVTATRLAGRPTPQGDAVADPALTTAMDAALDALPIGASRFGGVPDLPPGAAWPERDDVPMEFVAQLRLADLAAHPSATALPAAGSLLFFYNSRWDSSDMVQDRVCAVLHHAGADGELVRTPPPRVEFKSEFVDDPQLAPRIHGLASLAFAARASVPGGVSPFIVEPLRSFWQDFQAEHFATLTGRDPADRSGDGTSHLLGYVEAQDYVDAHVNGTADQLLFQVGSDHAAEFQWGDLDNLYFILSKAELAARDFSGVRLYHILG